MSNLKKSFGRTFGRFLLLTFTFSFAVGLEGTAYSAGKKTPTISAPVDGKRTVSLAPITNMRIEMPDYTMRDFGEAFNSGLTVKLTATGGFIVFDPDATTSPLSRFAVARSVSIPKPPTYIWDGSVVPVARVISQVQALSFQTGSRGDKMFYGFNERSQTPFNDGEDSLANEFPLLPAEGEPSWFGNSFVLKGTAPFDSRTGLDLGDGFSLNVLFAYLNVKYASYLAQLRMRVEYDLADGSKKFHLINVSGKGFFFDVAGAYQGYSAGLMVARRDALEQAVAKAQQAAFSSILAVLAKLPIMAKVDEVLIDRNLVLLGTGLDSQIKPGVLFQSVDLPGVVLEVSEAVPSGSVAEIRMGTLEEVQRGMLFKQIDEMPAIARMRSMSVSGAAPSTAPSTAQGGAGTPIDNINIPDNVLNSPVLTGLVPLISYAQAILKSIRDAVFLPYRIARYFQYDQGFHKRDPLGGGIEGPVGLGKILQRYMGVMNQAWATQIGLPQAAPMASASVPVVAVIDSGIDYNHPVLHSSLWSNQAPWTDPTGVTDYYGWDFISGDARPYDDNYHGTEVASAVLAVAPGAKIMPLKIFNPWGMTTSASIYAAFVYAVDHGASVILCGWGTGIDSKALKMGIAYAQAKDVAVVVATGDQGVNIGMFPVYPASYARQYDNVLPVAAVDGSDQRVDHTDYDASLRGIAAPGQNITVAEPRVRVAKVSSTGVAAGMVAGALARHLATSPAGVGGVPQMTGISAMRAVLEDAVAIAGLKKTIQGGLRLRVR